MKKYFKIIARAFFGALLVVVCVVCMFGTLIYYEQPESIPWAIGMCFSFIGSVACFTVEEDTSTAID